MNKFLFLSFAVLFIETTSAQQVNVTAPDTLLLGYDKTTTITFPMVVQSVDRGSGGIIVQRVNSQENIVQLKAAKVNFKPASVTVITADGKVYPFIAKFSDDPKLAISITGDDDISANIAGLPRFIYGVTDKSYDMKIYVSGIYYCDNILWFHLSIQNASFLPYDISSLRFFTKDKKRGKRTASQELELTPLYIYNNTGVVEGNSKVNFVVAFHRFTIPQGKVMYIQMREKDGGRNLGLKLTNKVIVQASPLVR